MSTFGSAVSEFLPDIAMEQLTEMQQGFVTAIRGLAVDTEEGKVECEALCMAVVDMYPPTMLLMPEMTRNPLLLRGLWTWLCAHGVAPGGDASMRSLVRVAATLYPAGREKDAAVSALECMDRRMERLCLHGDERPIVPGWPSGWERQAVTGSGGHTPRSSHAAPASAAEQLPGDHVAGPQDARCPLGAPSSGGGVLPGLPLLASYGERSSRVRDTGVRSAPMERGDAHGDSNEAYRIAQCFKDRSSKFSGDPQDAWPTMSPTTTSSARTTACPGSRSCNYFITSYVVQQSASTHHALRGWPRPTKRRSPGYAPSTTHRCSRARH